MNASTLKVASMVLKVKLRKCVVKQNKTTKKTPQKTATEKHSERIVWIFVLGFYRTVAYGRHVFGVRVEWS